MLHILLVILKILAIIVAAILATAVLLVCIVFFVPVRYQIEVKSDGGLSGIDAKIRISWLLHLFAGYVSYTNNQFSWQFRFLFKKLNVQKKKQVPQRPKVSREPEVIQESGISKEQTASKEMETSEKMKTLHKKEDRIEKTKTLHKKEDRTEKKNIFQKIKYTFQNICDKIKMFSERKEKVLEFIQEDTHILALVRLKQQIIRLAKFLRPKKLKMDIHFGFEDPCYTGKVLAVLSMFYPFYGEHIKVRPDFEQKVLEGELFIKGHIHGVYGVIVMWNLLFDKDVRSTYKHIKSFQF